MSVKTVMQYTYINVMERVYTERSFQITYDSYFSRSSSMAVTLHDHITSPVVFNDMCISFISLAMSESNVNYIIVRID